MDPDVALHNIYVVSGYEKVGRGYYVLLVERLRVTRMWHRYRSTSCNIQLHYLLLNECNCHYIRKESMDL